MPKSICQSTPEIFYHQPNSISAAISSWVVLIKIPQSGQSKSQPQLQCEVTARRT